MTDRASPRRAWRAAVVVAGLAIVLLFAGCQAIFTFSPVSGLQQSPADMTPAQRLTYAQDALASGDTTAMKNAYDAIKNDTGGQAQYVTAQLGIELSGVPGAIVDVTNNPSSSLTTINAYVAAHGIDPSYMVAAAGQLAAAAAAGVQLQTMDYAMGAMGLMLGYAQAAHGTWDVLRPSDPGGPTVTHAEAANAIAFLAPAVTNVASLSSGDTLKTFITDLNNFLGGF